ncbi:MAG: PD40 domain-containing protein [Bryobacterales bacterium]|nr:PD40 domain-containing protein [Bryobacterales bacterium]
MDWFQDGTKLLLSGPYGPKDRSGIWVFPLDGSPPRKLIDGANAAVLSPDNSRIAYVDEGIRLLNVSGGGARGIVHAPPGARFSDGLAWSPDGRRLAYGKYEKGGFSIERYDLDSGRTSVILSDPKAGSFCWTRDGRIIYSRQEEPPNETSANLWEIRVDPRTARVDGKPRRLTNWGGYLFDILSSGAGGARLSFVRKRFRSTVYVGNLESRGARLSMPRRLTSDEWINWPTAWSQDGRSVLLTSDRGGRLDIFRQNVEAPVPLAIVTGREERRDARYSSGGRWILYFASPDAEGQTPAAEGRLMRVAAGGGPPRFVLGVAGYPARLLVATEGTYPGATLLGHPRFRCPSAPQSLCVLSEKIGNQAIFTAFDPVEGRKRELARIDAPLPDAWDLSPDGQWIVLSRRWSGRIRLLSLTGLPSRDISLNDWLNIQCVAWAADGQAVFATAWASKEPPLLRISLDGEVTLMHKGLFHTENPVPSPDGRHIAFGEGTMESNVWVARSPR